MSEDSELNEEVNQDVDDFMHQDGRMGAQCAGLTGDLTARTCANPNAAAEEIEYLRRKERHAFRLRPRTPVRQIAKRERLGAILASTEALNVSY